MGWDSPDQDYDPDLETAVEKFARENRERTAEIQRPMIRKQTQVFPSILSYLIGKELGVSYQPIVQIVALNGRVVTQFPEVLK